MGDSEGVGNLGSPYGDLLDRPGNAAKDAERLALHQFGYERCAGLEAENFVDSDDVGVIEGRGSLSLAYEPFTSGREEAAALAYELDGDHTAKLTVAGGEDLPHTSRAKRRHKRIAPITSAGRRRFWVRLLVIDYSFDFFGNVGGNAGQQLTTFVGRAIADLLVELPNLRPVVLGHREKPLPRITQRRASSVEFEVIGIWELKGTSPGFSTTFRQAGKARLMSCFSGSIRN
jgi:hypothetical protein